MNAVVFGFEFMCGVAIFLFIAWCGFRWLRREQQPRVKRPLTARDWLWLSPVLLVVGYMLALAVGLVR